jgi:hypothetical protein
MNITTVIIGVAAILFGLYTAFLRAKQPGKLGKLEAMKKKFGATAGNLVHLIAYTVLPLVVGAVFIFSGIQGVALF